MRLREMDDLLCEYCCTGARRFTGTYPEKCIDCLADEFVVEIPASGLFEGFWGKASEDWHCDSETRRDLMPHTAHAHFEQPWCWETWIEEPRIADGMVQYLAAGVSERGAE